MFRLPALIVLAFTSLATSFPSYGSLAGLTESELEAIIPTLEIRGVEPPPGPLKFNGTMLVNDKDHPFMPLQPGDIRGPCPGLNTLASHGVCQEYFSCRF
jgi:unspecific peroxygenase